jgi:hypothetical protein
VVLAALLVAACGVLRRRPHLPAALPPHHGRHHDRHHDTRSQESPEGLFGITDPMRALGTLANVHRFSNAATGSEGVREILLLINFGWDPDGHLLRLVEGTRISFPTAHNQAHTLRGPIADDPEAQVLEFEIADGQVSATVPHLDAYGVLVVVG